MGSPLVVAELWPTHAFHPGVNVGELPDDPRLLGFRGAWGEGVPMNNACRHMDPGTFAVAVNAREPDALEPEPIASRLGIIIGGVGFEAAMEGLGPFDEPTMAGVHINFKDWAIGISSGRAWRRRNGAPGIDEEAVHIIEDFEFDLMKGWARKRHGGTAAERLDIGLDIAEGTPHDIGNVVLAPRIDKWGF
jgi:hypothetical protein